MITGDIVRRIARFRIALRSGSTWTGTPVLLASSPQGAHQGELRDGARAALHHHEILVLHSSAVWKLVGTGALFAGLLFSGLCALAGLLLAGPDAESRTALGFGTGLRNFPAALIVGVQSFRNPEVSVMIVVSSLMGLILLLPLAIRSGRRRGRAVAGLAPASRGESGGSA